MAGAPWFVYIAVCADGTLYTGVAVDVQARFRQHDAGRGARYTRGRGPLTLGAKTRCRDRSVALRLELKVKALSRDEKQALLASPRRLAALRRRVEAR